MEFFVCNCPATGNVILDGNDEGPNRDSAGNLLTKQCNTGVHIVSLQCALGKTCAPEQVIVLVENTDPILPTEVEFRCL